MFSQRLSFVFKPRIVYAASIAYALALFVVFSFFLDPLDGPDAVRYVRFGRNGTLPTATVYHFLTNIVGTPFAVTFFQFLLWGIANAYAALNVHQSTNSCIAYVAALILLHGNFMTAMFQGYVTTDGPFVICLTFFAGVLLSRRYGNRQTFILLSVLAGLALMYRGSGMVFLPLLLIMGLYSSSSRTPLRQRLAFLLLPFLAIFAFDHYMKDLLQMENVTIKKHLFAKGVLAQDLRSMPNTRFPDKEKFINDYIRADYLEARSCYATKPLMHCLSVNYYFDKWLLQGKTVNFDIFGETGVQKDLAMQYGLERIRIYPIGYLQNSLRHYISQWFLFKETGVLSGSFLEVTAKSIIWTVWLLVCCLTAVNAIAGFFLRSGDRAAFYLSLLFHGHMMLIGLFGLAVTRYVIHVMPVALVAALLILNTGVNTIRVRILNRGTGGG